MKTMKKLGAVVLALCMCMSLCVTAFAASGDDTGKFSITIENSMAGHEYNAYKIFDVTYDDNGNYSYTVESTSPWYTLFTDENNGVGSECPFEFTATTGTAANGATVYNVTIATDPSTNEAYTDEEIIAYLNAAIGQFATYSEEAGWTVSGISAAGTGTGTGSSITISVEEPGYYFVTSSLGAIVSITTTDPNPTIVDKNPTISIEKIIVADSGAEGHDDHAEADGMGEDVNFDVTANVPIVEGENYVVDYTITDSMTNGLLIELTTDQFHQGVAANGEDSTKYYLNDDVINEWITLYTGTYTDGEADTVSFTSSVYSYSFELIGYDVYTDETAGETVHTFSGFILTYYTYDVDQYKEDLATALTVAGYTLNDVWADYPTGWPDASLIGDDFDFPSEDYFASYSDENTVGTKYPTNASIEIQYSAHVSSLEGYENTNTIYLDHDVTPFSHPVPWQPTPGPQQFARDYVYSWELQILKYDGEDSSPLAGATFTLESGSMKDVKVGHSYLYVPLSLFEDGVYTDGEDTYYLADFETTHYILSNGSYVVGTAYDNDGETVDEQHTYVRILTSEVSVDEPTDYTVTGTTDESGYLYFEGLGTGVFTLTEIVAPDGYNLLTEPIVFEITFTESGDEETGYVGVFTVTYGSIDENGSFVPDTGDTGTALTDNYLLTEEIENNAGTILPGTGGMGTTIFYVVGAILICGAAVVLITRRRMAR